MGGERHQHGFFHSHQLLTTAPNEAVAFYRALFGWRGQALEQDGVEQHLMFNGDQPVATILGVPDDVDGAMPHWHPHMGVDDVDACTARAVELGGRVVVEPADIEGLGRLAVIQDPAGAVLTLVGLPRDDEQVPDAGDIDGD